MTAALLKNAAVVLVCCAPALASLTKFAGAAPDKKLFLPLPKGVPTYAVTDLAGQVLTRAPNGVQWLPVRRGDRLPEGQVVQVTPGSMITLKQQAAMSTTKGGKRSRLGGMDADEANLIINAPMLFRLGQNMLRKVELSRHFLDHTPEPPKAAAHDAKPAAGDTLKLAEAWHKMAAILTNEDPANARQNADMAELEKLGMALGVASKNLRILTPATNSQVVVPAFPGDLTITWDKEGDEPLDYEVYFWEARKPRGAPLAATREDHYELTLTQPGLFFVQVSAKNGSWQSAAHLLNIRAERPENDGAAKDAAVVVAPQKKPQPQSSLAALDFPPPTAEVRSANGLAAVGFFWHLKPAAATQPVQDAEVVILDPQGGELMRLDAKGGQSAPVKLKAGTYRWLLSLKLGAKEPFIDELTPTSELTIVPDQSPLASGLVSRVMAPGVHGLFLLENGL